MSSTDSSGDTPAITWIAGLGNPGDEYRLTRHNAGLWFVDRLERRLGVQLAGERRLSSRASRVRHGGDTLHLVAPTTYMNHSGQAVQAYGHYYKLAAASLLVAHDELDLPPGQVRLKRGGGHGGHNGLRDIIARCGTADFWRLRVGIGHPGHKNAVTAWVLRRPTADEQRAIDDALDLAAGEFEALLAGDFARVQQVLHSHRPEH